MSVFTVYCHGTGFNSVKGSQKDELVAWFHNHTKGHEAKLVGSLVTAGSYMINEGPGHGEVGGLVLPQQVNPMTGDLKKNLSFKKVISGPSFADHARGDTGGQKKMANKLGNLTGQGWDENVLRTVNLIQDLQFEKGQHIDRVNMVGWSRGAVTCIRIAHKLFEVFGESIECNIFGVDPVAGMDAGVKMTDTQVLQANVRNYIAVLAMHEMRKTFSPQDWSRMAMDPLKTTAVLLPMPGVHNAQVIPSNPRDAAYITRNLACGFLRHFGTQLDGTPYAHLNSVQEMCEAYGKLVLSLSEHKSYQTKGVGNRVVGTGLRRREFAKHSKMDTYTRGGKESYWINEHHRACFAAAFPGAYQQIFESTGSGELSVAKADFSLFKALGNSAGLRESLAAKGLMTAGTPFTIEIGAGRYANQMRAAWPADFPLHA